MILKLNLGAFNGFFLNEKVLNYRTVDLLKYYNFGLGSMSIQTYLKISKKNF